MVESLKRDNKGCFVKGFIPWNKGTKGIAKANSGSFKKGQTCYWKGKSFSEEYKIKLSEAHLGKPSPKKGIKLTEEQKEKMRGKNSYWWKGGVSIDYIKNLATRKWKQIANEIRKRDNYTCQECGKKPAYDVHHIIPWRLSKDDSEDNLITLCRSCHMKIEHKNGIMKKEINNEYCISR